jgi:DNA-binding LacI/PurR family transcriptional regulator
LISQGARRLRQLGHTHAALINRPAELLDRGYGPAVRALEAFEQARADLGMTGPAVCCDDQPDAARQCVNQIFAADPRLTAVLTINELALPGVLFALRERGLDVPADVSVLAVAAERIAATVHPQVSAADVPAEQMGRHAVETLLRLVSNPAEPLAHILLSPSLVDRGSVAAAPAAAAQDLAGTA